MAATTFSMTSNGGESERVLGDFYTDSFTNNSTNKHSSNSGNLRGLFGILNAINPSVTTDSSPSQLEYLFEDEYVQAGPSWGARLCYGAGLTYMGGLALGGSWGLLDGLRNPAGRGSRRLRWNCILNGCTARGPFVANHLAIVALLYNLMHGGLIRWRNGKEDISGAVGSAMAAGLLFKSTKGWRTAGLTSLAFGALMGAYQGLATYLERGGSTSSQNNFIINQ